MTGTGVAVAVAAVLALLLVGVYLSWTAGRLDRMHARVDASWAALDAQLARRAAAARALVPLLPPEPAELLDTAAHASLEAGEAGREEVENDLSRVVRMVLPALPRSAAVEELEAATARVGLARTLHNAAVTDTRALRRRRVPRLLHLAGRRAVPDFFEIDDTATPRLADTPDRRLPS